MNVIRSHVVITVAITSVIVLFIYLGIMVISDWKERSFIKHKKINECVLENKHLPNPRNVCESSHHLGLLK